MTRRRGTQAYELCGHNPRPICMKCRKEPQGWLRPSYMISCYIRKNRDVQYGKEHWQVKRSVKLVKVGYYCQKCGSFIPLEPKSASA